MLGRSLSQHGRMGKKINIPAVAGNRTSVIQPLVSHCRDRTDSLTLSSEINVNNI
jgi:hypothetical protein